MSEMLQGNMGPVPNYKITRRPDLSFQFDPPVGSLELANALAIKYPLELGLESQLRRALLDHLESDHSTSPTSGQLTSMYPPPESASNDQTIPARPWRITTGNPAGSKRKRSTYTRTKRKKVAEVRRLGACPEHRKKKTEVRQFLHKVKPKPRS